MMKTQPITRVTELRAVELLSRAQLFKSLTPEDKRVFAMAPGLFRYAKSGVEFIEQGDADYCIYVVMSGKAKVFKDGIHVGDIEAGQFVGEVSFVTREVRTASVQATTDMIMLRIDAENFRKLPIRAREIMKDKMIEGLHDRVARMNKEMQLLRIRNEELEGSAASDSEEEGQTDNDETSS